jgi:superfamily II DNA helicase RecQ
MADLYNQLRELRKKLADSEQVEVFRVFQNVTIDEIVAKKPKNGEELLEVKWRSMGGQF